MLVRAIGEFLVLIFNGEKKPRDAAGFFQGRLVFNAFGLVTKGHLDLGLALASPSLP